MKWIFKIFIIFVFCGFYVRYKQEFKKAILDKHPLFRLVRVNMEVNLILTCRSCSKLWSTGLGCDNDPLGPTPLGIYLFYYLLRGLFLCFLLLGRIVIKKWDFNPNAKAQVLAPTILLCIKCKLSMFFLKKIIVKQFLFFMIHLF